MKGPVVLTRIAIVCLLLSVSVFGQESSRTVPLSTFTVTTETETIRTDIAATITVTPKAKPKSDVDATKGGKR